MLMAAKVFFLNGIRPSLHPVISVVDKTF